MTIWCYSSFLYPVGGIQFLPKLNNTIRARIHALHFKVTVILYKNFQISDFVDRIWVYLFKEKINKAILAILLIIVIKHELNTQGQ